MTSTNTKIPRKDTSPSRLPVFGAARIQPQVEKAAPARPQSVSQLVLSVQTHESNQQENADLAGNEEGNEVVSTSPNEGPIVSPVVGVDEMHLVATAGGEPRGLDLEDCDDLLLPDSRKAEAAQEVVTVQAPKPKPKDEAALPTSLPSARVLRSLRRPNSYMGPSGTTVKPAISRTATTKSKMGPPPSVLTKAGARANQDSRPPSSASVKNSEAKGDSSRPTSQVAQRRPPSANSDSSKPEAAPSKHVRRLSQFRPLEHPNQGVDSKKRHSVSRSISNSTAKDKKPPFSTLQQHFTPKKATGAILRPNAASPTKTPSQNTITAETAKLQLELLQLHLLHRHSDQVRAEWSQSAKEKIGKKFEDLAQRHRDLRQREAANQTRLNLQALQDWADASSIGFGLDERSQLLSRVLQELMTLVETGGKFSRVSQDFDRWIHLVDAVWKKRESTAVDRTAMVFIESLGEEWKHDVASLLRKSSNFLSDFMDIGEAKTGSDLAFLISNGQAIAQGMSEELSIMRSLHSRNLAREKAWVSRKIEELPLEIADVVDGRKGVWRTL